jgi:hypothetical protein
LQLKAQYPHLNGKGGSATAPGPVFCIDI